MQEIYLRVPLLTGMLPSSSAGYNLTGSPAHKHIVLDMKALPGTSIKIVICLYRYCGWWSDTVGVTISGIERFMHNYGRYCYQLYCSKRWGFQIIHMLLKCSSSQCHSMQHKRVLSKIISIVCIKFDSFEEHISESF